MRPGRLARRVLCQGVARPESFSIDSPLPERRPAHCTGVPVMAIRFKCPKCGAELNVKDELAGKQGRCPACKNAVTVPRLAPARRKVEEVVEAEVVEEVEEIDEVEYVDEDEPPRRPVGIKRRRDIEDED